MINKQELVTALLCRHLSEIKVGIIVKGVDDISPEEIIKEIASEEKHLYAAAIGYDEVIEFSEELYDITNSIEKAVLWRSMPECAGSIIVFIRKLAALQKQRDKMKADAITIGGMMFELGELDALPLTFDEKLWHGTIDHVTVHADERVVFMFKDGKEIVTRL